MAEPDAVLPRANPDFVSETENFQSTVGKMLEERDVRSFVYCFFNYKGAPIQLTPTQVEIVRTIAFSEHKRIVINCCTRFGKSLSTAVAVCLYILLSSNKKVCIIAPIQQQAELLRNYLSAIITESPLLRDMIDIELSGIDRLKKEASKRRQTFRNGCEYQVFSAEGEGDRLMGFGGDLIVCHPADTKICTDEGFLTIGDIVENRRSVKILTAALHGLEWKPIEKYFSHPENEILSVETSGGMFECTFDHPVLCSRGWVAAKSLRVGDMCLGLAKNINIPDARQHCDDGAMRGVWDRILLASKPLRARCASFLQQGVFRKVLFGRFLTKDIVSLPKLQEENHTEKMPIREKEGTLLFNTLSRHVFSGKQKPAIRDSNRNLRVVPSPSRNKAFYARQKSLLFPCMCKRASRRTNDCCRQPCLERRDSKDALCLRLHKNIKKAVERGPQLFLSALREILSIKSSSHTSHRLRQKKYPTRKSLPPLPFLSWKDSLQKRPLEKHIVTKVAKLDKKEPVYNIKVQGNHNYFSNGILTHNCDESCLISPEIYASKISRMLADSPDSALVEIGNPWHREGQMWKHWNDPKFKRIHVNWQRAVQEGRFTEAEIEEQRNELSAIPTKFKVLWDAEFPEETEDALFKAAWIEDAVRQQWTEANFAESEFIMGVDVADKGLDQTVLIIGRELGGRFMVLEILSEAKSEQVSLCGKILHLRDKYNITQINVDGCGLGIGLISMLRSQMANRHCTVTSCLFSGGTSDPSKRYLNRKSEAYFRLAKIFEKRLIKIPDHVRLKDDLMKTKWEFTMGSKTKISEWEPEKTGHSSPDFADALVYFTWKQQRKEYAIF